MFINPQETLTVHDDKGNSIVIKAKMDFADYAKVEAALMQLKLKSGTNGSTRPADQAEMEIDATVTYSAQKMALLKVCIRSWDGPDFVGVVCSEANIARLDPNEPLVEKVLDVINQRNEEPTKAPPAAPAPDPNFQEPPTFAE
jgi:hypothetical protein